MQGILEEAHSRADKLLTQLREDLADLDQPHRIDAQTRAEGKVAIQEAIQATESFIQSLTANQD
jgi:hypothetical protein